MFRYIITEMPCSVTAGKGGSDKSSRGAAFAFKNKLHFTAPPVILWMSVRSSCLTPVIEVMADGAVIDMLEVTAWMFPPKLLELEHLLHGYMQTRQLWAELEDVQCVFVWFFRAALCLYNVSFEIISRP